MKKLLSTILVCGLLAASLAGCGSNDEGTTTQGSTGTTAATEDGSTEGTTEGTTEAASDFDTSRSISVISREDGSGTRGAFIELMGIEVKGEDGSSTDMTTVEADIASRTDVMLTSVAGDPYAIGYVSMGSLNETVKAVKAVAIDGVEATTDNIINGTYAVSRPFNIATNGEPTGLVKDFIDFILSAEGQAIVAEDYIAVDSEAPAYAGEAIEGTISVGGSSSVSPVMEQLIEAYQAVNPNATIELQTTDSTSGMTGVAEGTLDIGMASRALKDTEAETLNGIQIALDGIAVIVNTENPIDNLTSEQVRQIYVGEVTSWADVQ